MENNTDITALTLRDFIDTPALVEKAEFVVCDASAFFDGMPKFSKWVLIKPMPACGGKAAFLTSSVGAPRIFSSVKSALKVLTDNGIDAANLCEVWLNNQ